MNAPFSSDEQKTWDEVRRAARALTRAGGHIADACRILDRFCLPSDPANWDRSFAWKTNELKQAVDVCREVSRHLSDCAKQASTNDTPEGR
jgi:hypothetical protein